jgi:hypothetical protein
VDDTLTLLYSFSDPTRTGLPGRGADLFEVRFTCQAGTTFHLPDFPCAVVEATDVGGTVDLKNRVPCALRKIEAR